MPERKPAAKKPAKTRGPSPEVSEPSKARSTKSDGRTAVAKKPKPAKRAPRPKAPKKAPEELPVLTPEEKLFQERLEQCLPQEREFIKHKLARRNNTEAAILAGYSQHTAEEQGARLLGRVRVREAFNAGLDAANLGAKAVLDDIQALRTFDRSQIEREIKVRTYQTVERPAEEVIQQLITREGVAERFLRTAEKSDYKDEALLKQLQRRLNGLLMERLELEEKLALDPDAVAFLEVEQITTKRVIDYDLARERGLLRFIKGVKPSKFGDIIELHDWVDAVDMAARTHGLYKERHEVTGKNGGPIEADFKGLEGLTGAALMDRYKALLESDAE